MNKREAENYGRLLCTLFDLGFSGEEIDALIRIEKTLHRWCERECGDDHGCIERDDATGKPLYRRAMSGKAWPIADREAGALRRLRKIIEARNERFQSSVDKWAKDNAEIPSQGLSWYYQGDCRGCALYILRPGDVPEGESQNAYYNRGIAICY